MWQTYVAFVAITLFAILYLLAATVRASIAANTHAFWMSLVNALLFTVFDVQSLLAIEKGHKRFTSLERDISFEQIPASLNVKDHQDQWWSIHMGLDTNERLDIWSASH